MATLQIYVSKELKASVEKAAKEQDRSVSYMSKQWIEDGLKRYVAAKARKQLEVNQ